MHHKRSRSRTLFNESIKSKYTKINYNTHLREFKKFADMSNIDELLIMSSEELQNLLEDYLMNLKQFKNPNSIPTKFQGIKHFCVMNRIGLDWNIIYKMFPSKQKTSDLRSYTTTEIRQMLLNTKNIRDKALIHFLASTGARVGVFDHELLFKHLIKMSHGCYAVKLYAGHVEEYWSFLTPQASEMLNMYHGSQKQDGKVFCEDTPIFTTQSSFSKQLGWSGVRSIIYRTIAKSEIFRYKQENRYDVQADHGFRKRFNTVLKMNNLVNYNIAEKLMGHKNGLDGIYFTPTLDELFMEFKKVMHKIQI